MRTHHHWLGNLFCGLLIGAACILPGASGGVLAVSFGLYRPMLDAVMHFFRTPGKHLAFLVPLGAGISAGIMLGAACLAGAFERYEQLMLFLFIGMILGGIPDLLQEAQQREHFRPAWLLSLAAGVLAALPLCLSGGQNTPVRVLSPLQALASGILEGVGTIIPGFSTSFILIRLGWYQAYLSAVSSADPAQLVMIIPGFAAAALACMHLVQLLFDRYTGHAFYAVLGFLLISVAAVFPGFTLNRIFWAQAAMLIIGITVVRIMGQMKNQKE